MNIFSKTFSQYLFVYFWNYFTFFNFDQLPALIDSYVYLQRYQTYDLLLWRANNNAESFKIKWKQRNSIKMCISMSYLLEDQSKCTFSMYLTNEDSLDKQVIYSYDHIKESVNWFCTCIYQIPTYKKYRYLIYSIKMHQITFYELNTGYKNII